MSDHDFDPSDAEENSTPLETPQHQDSADRPGVTLATPARRKAQAASLAEPIPLGRNRGRGRGTTTEKQRQRQKATAGSSTIPRGPPPIVRPDNKGAFPVVNGQSCTALPESYTEDEHALNMFTKLHPMVRHAQRPLK